MSTFVFILLYSLSQVQTFCPETALCSQTPSAFVLLNIRGVVLILRDEEMIGCHILGNVFRHVSIYVVYDRVISYTSRCQIVKKGTFGVRVPSNDNDFHCNAIMTFLVTYRYHYRVFVNHVTQYLLCGTSKINN
jgi:hypothetical protein